MTMKKLYIKTLIFMSIIGLWGCEDMFENEVPPHNLVGDNAITNESSAETALNGVYSYLDGYGPFDAKYIVYDEYRTGLLTGGHSMTEDEMLLLGQVTIESSIASDPWKTAFQMINAANNFIYYVEQLPESAFGEGRQTEMLAEAKFMRAFAHSLILKRYGYFFDTNSELGALMRMEPSTISNNNMPRSTVAESYRLILEDYDYAITYGSEFIDNLHACATTAKAFKADMLMNRGAEGDYEEAIRLAGEVLNSSEFEMDTTFAGVFEKGYDSKELLFTRTLTTLPEAGDNSGNMLKYFGQGLYAPSDKFFEFFPEEDKRYKATLDSMEIDKGGVKLEKELIWTKHYKSDGNCPMYYMRLAQMHLIRAEAMAYTGAATKDVIEELNVLRRRSKNTELKAEDYPDENSLLRLIFQEYVREIGMENGALYYLAVRMKINGSRFIFELNTNYSNEDQLVIPIPDDEMNTNSKIEQKPL